MIRVERGGEISPGVFAYTVPSLALSGRSRQPLLMPAGKLSRSLARPDSLQGYSVRHVRSGISVAGLMWEPSLRSRKRAPAESTLLGTSHSRRRSVKPLSKAAP
jgi:hypothetical protein